MLTTRAPMSAAYIMPLSTQASRPNPHLPSTLPLTSVVFGAMPVIRGPFLPATWVAVQVPCPLKSSGLRKSWSSSGQMTFGSTKETLSARS
jgi:hypothetical protein